MDREPVLGIDLGTTNSEVAVLRDGRPEVVGDPGSAVLPSCVGLDIDGNVVVGVEARNQMAAAPERTVHSVKRLMGSDSRVALGDHEYSPPEISAFILKALKARAEETLGRPADRAVVTVPAYFTDAQRQATREAGEIAGLEVVRIINEPTAAALSYGERREARRKLLVYDLGGGTFDVSVVSVEDGVVEVLASTGDNELGGDDFDAAIVAILNDVMESELGIADVRDDTILQARIRNAAEAAKITLSQQPYVLIEEDHVGTVDGAARHLSYELSRSEFETAIEDMLLGTLRSVTTALNDANVRPSELDRVLLVGGSTRIPRIIELLRERLGHEPHGEIDPDLCVALGAGVQAGMEMGTDMQAILVDITPYTFGTSCIGEVHGVPSAHQYVPIIRRNSRLPVTRSDVFFKVYEEQRAVAIDVYQGEDPDARRNVRIGMFHFENLDTDAAAQDKGILVTYSLDLDGILHVRAVERMTGREIRGSVESPLARSTVQDVNAARERIAREWGDDGDEAADDDLAALTEILDAQEHQEVADVLRRADELKRQAPADDRAELIELTEQLRDAVGNSDRDTVLSAKQNLDELLYYLE